MEIDRNSFVALSAGIDVGGDLIRAVIYINKGYMDWSQWFYVPALGIAAVLGATSGKYIPARISQTQFKTLVTIFVLISGIMMAFG